MQHYGHFIDGGFTNPGDAIDSVNPFDGKVWCRFSRGGTVEVDQAVRAADRAFRSGRWAEAGHMGHADFLDRLADVLQAEWQSLVETEIRDNGKRCAEVRGQFAALHQWYRHFARQARALAPTPQENAVPGVTSAAHHVPYGVIAAITPWNSPLMILAWKIGPALAAGNTVVVKPSEMASASTLEFAALAARSGLPRGVLNVVTGYGHEAGAALVGHDLVRKVSFTGSDAGGRRVAVAASNRIVPATLELGGKSAQIVFADADPDNTVNGILAGIFLSNGQTCVAGSRLIVETPLRDSLVARLVERASALRMGDPLDPATEVGPLANAAHFEKVRDMIARAKAQGARCLLDGTAKSHGAGYFVGPTIFDRVTPAMELWREEVFGPVLAITDFAVETQAIRLANDSRYGLAAGIWTADADRGARVAALIDAGTVYVNHYRSVDPGAPVGGMKLSGYGRELGPDAVHDFLQTKSIWVGRSPMPDPFPREGDTA